MLRFLKFMAVVCVFALIAVFLGIAMAATDSGGNPLVASPIKGTIDFGPFLTALVTLLAPSIGAVLAWVAYELRRLFHVQQGSSDANLIDMAVQRAGGVAYNYLVRAAADHPTVNLHDEAIANGVNHVLGAVPDTLSKLGVTPERVKTMVTGELGKLQAADPNVTITPRPATP